ncbi:hypothetical protein PR048_020144 [Dryococelus australis]|uniref:Uncharacterized protein n=1 Tax=Dryococelus australis TaxID=614101 RepID=A0ABQ9H5H8_9NEOP|nr:hypothetical protein PR048_020144 [Dryococelus australis]
MLKASSYETSLSNILKAKQEDAINEDKHFAVMFVPMLRKLDDEEKHYTKVEILNEMPKARHFQLESAFRYSDGRTSSQTSYSLPTHNFYPQTLSQYRHIETLDSLENFTS